MASQLVVLITGCSFGLGRNLAKTFASDEQKRYKVWATVRALHEKEGLEREAGSLLNETLFIKELDLTKPQSIEDASSQILDEDGRVDILINNAAIPLFGTLEDINMEKVHNLFEINFFGHIQLMQLLIPSMKNRKYGRIINISTCGTLQATPFLQFYVASKLALEGVTQCQAPTLRPFNVWPSIVQLPAMSKTTIADVIESGEHDQYVVKDKLDDTTRQMFNNVMDFQKRYMFSSCAHTPDEISEYIVTIVQEESPKLRYVPDGGKYFASITLRDPTGENNVKTMTDVISPR